MYSGQRLEGYPTGRRIKQVVSVFERCTYIGNKTQKAKRKPYGILHQNALKKIGKLGDAYWLKA